MPRSLSHRDFDSVFTRDELTYNRTNPENIHVHGYREKGNINASVL
jgi:xylulose-5-phosphate/fructose-6-phosphate phosphoketolase